MTLTSEQKRMLENGDPVHIIEPETQLECVLIRSDVYDRARSVLEEDLDPEHVAALIEQTMREYDADDPLLESYQKYRP